MCKNGWELIEQNISKEKYYKFLDNLVQSVVKLLCVNKLKFSSAESCTGGMLSQYITSVPGASAIFEMGICTYSNRIKTQELNVSSELFDSYGAVSEQVAIAMAEGIRIKSGADIGIGITGIAGPDGGTLEKPIGTVFVAVCYRHKRIVKNLKLYEFGKEFDREQIRILSTILSLEMLVDIIKER